ncbi:MAG: succinate dehydrogenase, hydrophobic membrane anchor protein, partial [Sphingomonadaceae bacterium]
MGTGTGIGRVRGLGSARHGSKHWLHQRFTAIGNLVLVLWLLFSLLILPSLDHGAVVAWLSSPIVAVPMMLMVVSIFWHLKIGMQVMMEDYVHD